MKVIKKYTAIQLRTETVNSNVNVKLEYGCICGPYYDEVEPTEEFDTEEEAIEHIYKFDKWSRWIIVPLIKFDTIDEKY
jgi:hypothetical protein